ncbi:acyl--CoA ligase [Rothia sp. AR01]|uniref:Acyl--CoA ligase n=1 Tax=Rothia santali TaxID=2949643 RepID=A0A9X2HL45_9MICC|nr:class I adenylate-forming enzyme family protein [Rothia santali]MCP3426948.1 acyl--CoA ligase [Rothia santali]
MRRFGDSQWSYFREFLDVAGRRSDEPALVDASQRLTYGDLVREVERRSATLREVGLRHGDRVALVADNSVNYILTAFAIWLADGVLVTIYPSTSAADLRATLADADPVLALGDDGTRELVAGAAPDGVATASIDGDFRPPPIAAEASNGPTGLSDALHMICYSSGTTSRPKAIMLSARSLYNGARTYADVWGLGVDDVTVVCLPMAWLYGLNTSAMSTLLGGGVVVALRRSKPEMLAEAIQAHRVTFFPAVTTVLTKFTRFVSGDERRWDLSSLRLIVSGGEPRNEQAFEQLRQLTGIPVHDTYCASELFPLITYDPRRDPEPRPGAAGRLVPRSNLRIVDEHGSEVKDGETGEALTNGPGLMLGYWNDPELTAVSMTDDGWYKTKDLVRRDVDGYVYVVGRLSDMIIRGGSNISPAEIEAVLRRHPDVLDVAVVGRPDPMYGEEVVSVIQPAPGASATSEDLKTFAASQLSGFKVPTAFARVSHLPQNSTTHKVSRAAVKSMLEKGEITC